MSALDMGVPAPTVAEAVFARFMSAMKEERVAASKVLTGAGDSRSPARNRKTFVHAVHDALYCSKICSYAQGFQLMRSGRRTNTDGSCASATSPRSGAAAASSARGSCRRSPKRTNAMRSSRTCCSIRISPARSSGCQANWRSVIAAAAIQRAARADVLRPRWRTTIRYRSARTAGESAAGAARLLRRAHLRARRPARAASSSTSTGRSRIVRRSKRSV